MKSDNQNYGQVITSFPELGESANTSVNVNHPLEKIYEKLEKRFLVRVISSDVSYVTPINFAESIHVPRHRWFPYKEGFSPTFVKNFITEFSMSGSGIILDPFSGVGTTGLVASKMGFDAIGFDVSSMATFIARTKSTQLSVDELVKFNQFINEVKYSPLNETHPAPENETVKSYYDEEYLSALLAIRKLVECSPSKKIHDLTLLAFLSLVEEFSTHRKAGNGVKRKTKYDFNMNAESPLENVRKSFLTKLSVISFDLENDQLTCVPDFRTASCLNSDSVKDLDTIGLILTSPPYANCFDYSKIYMRELWLGGFFKSAADQKEFRSNSIRSHVHATWEDRHTAHGSEIAESLICRPLASQKLWSNKIPSMISGYFKDMGALLNTIYPRLSHGASFGIVVGNSMYGGISVASDLLIAEMAESIGYKVLRIDVYRKIVQSSQQYTMVENRKWARESTVIIKKP